MSSEYSWEQNAACKDVSPELFYGDEKGHFTSRQEVLAKNVCRICDVRRECLENAFEEDDQATIRGGLTPNERVNLQRRATRRSGYNLAS